LSTQKPDANGQCLRRHSTLAKRHCGQQAFDVVKELSPPQEISHVLDHRIVKLKPHVGPGQGEEFQGLGPTQLLIAPQNAKHEVGG